MEKRVKIIVEKHPDGYVAYSLGLEGCGCRSRRHVHGGARRRALHCRIPRSDVRGRLNGQDDSPVIEAFVAGAGEQACLTDAPLPEQHS